MPAEVNGKAPFSGLVACMPDSVASTHKDPLLMITRLSSLQLGKAACTAAAECGSEEGTPAGRHGVQRVSGKCLASQTRCRSLGFHTMLLAVLRRR